MALMSAMALSLAISCDKEVKKEPLESVSFSKTGVFLRVGDSENLYAHCFPTIYDTDLFEWPNPYPDIITISPEDQPFVNITGTAKGFSYIYPKIYRDGEIIFRSEEKIVVVVENKIVAEPVDLGLSVKWASCNVGAASPEDVGNKYSWGDTRPYYVKWFSSTKGIDSKGNEFYPLYNGSYKHRSEDDWYHFTKYQCRDGETRGIWYDDAGQFIGDGKTELEKEDDVASLEWGYNWRIPTEDEMDELLTKCRWVFAVRNGVKGYEVTGKTGKSIFLPYDSEGYGYWTSSLYNKSTAFARKLYLRIDEYGIASEARILLEHIRPVI